MKILVLTDKEKFSENKIKEIGGDEIIKVFIDKNKIDCFDKVWVLARCYFDVIRQSKIKNVYLDVERIDFVILLSGLLFMNGRDYLVYFNNEKGIVGLKGDDFKFYILKDLISSREYRLKLGVRTRQYFSILKKKGRIEEPLIKKEKMELYHKDDGVKEVM